MCIPDLFYDTLPDNRFRALLGADAWRILPTAIRNRFGIRLSNGASVTYQGIVTAMKLSLVGKVLANAARLIGAPLPYDLSSVGQPAIVSVTEDASSSGQFWIRQYGRAAGFPQILHSSKRFAGPTGLEEYVGYGIGMALKIQATSDALLFRSDHYFLQILGKRLRLPQVLSPGALTIGHHDLGNRQFTFSLTLTHRLFGQLIRQDAIFHDAKE